MHSITIAYSIGRHKGKSPIAFRLNEFLNRLDHSMFPILYGHGFLCFESPLKTIRFGFGPKKKNNIFLKERRSDAHLLDSSYAHLSPVARISILTNKTHEGFVHHATQHRRDAYIRIGVNEDEFLRALSHAESYEHNPPTFRQHYSNCIAFTINVARKAGFDLAKHAGQRNILLPDGYLVSILNVTKEMLQTGGLIWEGEKDGKPVKVGFNDPDLYNKACCLSREKPGFSSMTRNIQLLSVCGHH